MVNNRDVVPNERSRDTVLVDIDHCLSNAFPRDELIGNVSWDEYHEKACDDECIHDMRALVNAMSATGHKIIGLTSRPEKWHLMTMSWLIRHDIVMHNILMRPADDFRGSKELKLSLAANYFGGEDELKLRIAFVIDDRADVLEAFAGVGVTTLQVSARRD